jgi:hypothetical protein
MAPLTITLQIGDSEPQPIGTVDPSDGQSVYEAVADALQAAAAIVRERVGSSPAEQAGPVGQCACGKWPAYFGTYDTDGHTLRCRGCLRATWRCTCR